MTTPLARVAAYTRLAALRGTDLIDTIPNGAHTGRLQLHAADLTALLDLHADLCPDVVRCETCHTVLCDTHGLGEQTDCDCDITHCADNPWCWGQACMDAHRIDQNVDAARDEAMCP